MELDVPGVVAGVRVADDGQLPAAAGAARPRGGRSVRFAVFEVSPGGNRLLELQDVFLPVHVSCFVLCP
jgi:hypothetical protein